MDEWKVVEAVLRPYMPRGTDPASLAIEVIRGLASAGFALVELPVPTDLGPYGPIWDIGSRHTDLPIPEYGGPVGTVQYRPEAGRIEVRDDYEHDYLPKAVWADAAVLIAACCYAAQAKVPTRRWEALIVKDGDPLTGNRVYVDAATVDEAMDLVHQQRPSDYHTAWVQPYPQVAG